jgi:hypothetical protein
MKKMLFLVMVVLLVSCEKSPQDAEALGENADIIGTWVEEGKTEEMTLLARAENLDQPNYGFTIQEDGTFLERKNAGWCGTPPITYGNFEGNWVALSDSLLEITVGYWGGTMTYQMRIVFLEQEHLGIRYLYADNRVDSR